MRLLAHNMLRNTAKGVEEGYPLRIEATKVEVRATPVDEDFVRNLLDSVSLQGLREAVSNLGLDVNSVPQELTPTLRQDKEFLHALHKLLMDVHVIEGALICPETGRRFPIQNGIPNLTLEEDELK